MTTDAQCTGVTATERPVYPEDVMKALKEQGKVSTTGPTSEKSVSLDDVMRIIVEQGKVITELTQALNGLTIQNPVFSQCHSWWSVICSIKVHS